MAEITRELRENILSRIPRFARQVEPIFQANNWRMFVRPGFESERVPTAEDLEVHCRNLLSAAVNEAILSGFPATFSAGRIAIRITNANMAHLELVPVHHVIYGC